MNGESAQVHFQQKLSDRIRGMWGKLTDEEIETHKDYRDMFFIAVKKKHGIVRAQAEWILKDLEQEFCRAA